MPYRIGNTLYEVSDRLMLVKAAKPAKTLPKRVDSKQIHLQPKRR